MMRRKFATFTLKEAMQLIPVLDFIPWSLSIPPLQPSDNLLTNLQRLKAFDLETTEEAKTLLIDALLWEIVPLHPTLKVWKGAPLETDTLLGTADYLVSPKLGYITTPLLGVAEAKKDDFVQGRAQCLTEMFACQWNNRQENHDIDIYGIVSNGQVWQFYKLTLADEVFESGLYTVDDLPKLLGALDYICGECAKNVP